MKLEDSKMLSVSYQSSPRLWKPDIYGSVCAQNHSLDWYFQNWINVWKLNEKVICSQYFLFIGYFFFPAQSLSRVLVMSRTIQSFPGFAILMSTVRGSNSQFFRSWTELQADFQRNHFEETMTGRLTCDAQVLEKHCYYVSDLSKLWTPISICQNGVNLGFEQGNETYFFDSNEKTRSHQVHRRTDFLVEHSFK